MQIKPTTFSITLIINIFNLQSSLDGQLNRVVGIKF